MITFPFPLGIGDIMSSKITIDVFFEGEEEEIKSGLPCCKLSVSGTIMTCRVDRCHRHHLSHLACAGIPPGDRRRGCKPEPDVT